MSLSSEPQPLSSSCLGNLSCSRDSGWPLWCHSTSGTVRLDQAQELGPQTHWVRTCTHGLLSSALPSGGALGCNLFPPTVFSGLALPPSPLCTGIRCNLNPILALSVFTNRWRPIGCDHIEVQRLFPSGFLCRARVLFYIRPVFLEGVTKLKRSPLIFLTIP